jgi:lysozyme
MRSRQLAALLYAIRRSEHSASDVASGADYFTFYGGVRFAGTSDHPALTGEMQGTPLPDSYCLAAGMQPGCVSTAAGAYQINLPTWRRIRVRNPFIFDFSPASQDEAAVRLITERGADRLLAQGLVDQAIYRLSPVWASLPRSQSGQPQRAIADVLAFYDEGLALA